MGKFFGKHVTSAIAVNEKICGEGSFGVVETYDTYFFGIRTSTGNTRTKCIKNSLTSSTETGGSVDFNSTIDEIEQIALRKYVVTRSGTTGWYRWTCKDDASKSGVSSSKSGAAAAGKSACGSGQVIIDDINVTKLQAHYEVQKTNV